MLPVVHTRVAFLPAMHRSWPYTRLFPCFQWQAFSPLLSHLARARVHARRSTFPSSKLTPEESDDAHHILAFNGFCTLGTLIFRPFLRIRHLRTGPFCQFCTKVAHSGGRGPGYGPTVKRVDIPHPDGQTGNVDGLFLSGPWEAYPWFKAGLDQKKAELSIKRAEMTEIAVSHLPPNPRV